MVSLNSIAGRFITLVFDKQNFIKLILSFTGILVGLSFLNGGGTDHNYIKFFEHISRTGWSVIFITYGIVKLISGMARVPLVIKILDSVVGLWAWIYLLLSCSYYDVSAFEPLEITICIPIALEFVHLVADLWAKSHCLNRRGRDL